VTRQDRLERIEVLHGTRAGFVSRVIAAATDVAVVVVIETAIFAFLALVRWVVGAGEFQLTPPRGWVAALIGAALPVIYLGYLWATTGRTVGEQILGLRTLTDHGVRVRPLRSYLRAVLAVAFPVGLLWVLVSRKNASVQDLLCRTAVVYDWSYHAPAS
jgi:uncharacterized RDD family membrane protein YckC